MEWYHGPIRRDEAVQRLRDGTFLVRERVAHIWYEVMTPALTITVRRRADGSGFKVLGLPTSFPSLEAAVDHLLLSGSLS